MRGRVGRSRERGYAYFLYPAEKPLTETAHDRLVTIAQHSELGGGMAVAMKDLEIRGAGNLLGGEQSGHIAGVGFDLYVRMVGEAVADYRGDEGNAMPVEIKIELPVDAHLPHEYVPGERLRLEAYKKLASVEDEAALDEIIAELKDRYGEPPQPVLNLFDVARLRTVARKAGISPSKLLMPLSYFTVMGGMITLIGTSTNLLVDGVVRARGLEPFGIFDIAPVGLAVTAAGATFIALVGWRLLPDRGSMASFLTDRSQMRYFTEIAIPEDSNIVGMGIADVKIFQREGVRVIDVLRGDASLRRNMAEVVLEAGDRVVLRSGMADLLEMQQDKSLRTLDKLSSVQTEMVEVLISPGARMIGRRLGDLRLRRRYGVYPIAAHRRNQNIGRQLDDLEIRVGDTLLLEGAREDIARLAADMDLVDVSHPTTKAFRRRHAPIATAALLAVVLLAALDVAPIMGLAFLAAAVVLITGCVDPDEAFGFVEARLLALIRGMGARTDTMDPAHHDLVLAVTSHAPHLIAYTMVGVADHLRRVTESEVIRYLAAGFRDFTRIAASDPTMWRDVFLHNKDATLDILGRFAEELFVLQRAIRMGDGEHLHKYFTGTRAIRRGIIEAGQDTAAPDFGRAAAKTVR